MLAASASDTHLTELLRNGANGRNEQAALAGKVEQLRAKLVQKNEVIAELMEANVLAKKELGEL